ncbi:MAG: hypothetical protein QM523_03850 [Candidatus Pacebacteria bacterium]|nr:hypothetical protein [Candidatus Paceibacterota bacterium]
MMLTANIHQPRSMHLRANLHRAVKRSLRQFRYIFFVQPKYRRDLVMRPQPYPKPERLLPEGVS